MERVRDAFLVLLRAGLWGKFPENRGLFPLDEEEWERVFAMSRRQSVSGIVFDGICLLPETLQPSPAVFAKWIVIADAIEEFSGRMNAALKDLTGLFVSEGLRPVLQKGQGVAALYPEPSHRECGDIDFYFPERQPLRQVPRPGKESPLPVADPAKVTRETMDDKAVELVRRHGVTVTRMPDGSQTYEWHGIDVEHHSAIIDLRSPAAIRLSGELDETREFVPTDIADGLRVPSPALNALMLNSHILKHALGRGIGLRQMCDLAMAYHRISEEGKIDEYGGRILAFYRRVGIVKWSRLLHSFLVGVIGLPEAELPYSEKIVPYGALWRIVEEGGNFGQHRGGGREPRQGRMSRQRRVSRQVRISRQGRTSRQRREPRQVRMSQQGRLSRQARRAERAVCSRESWGRRECFCGGQDSLCGSLRKRRFGQFLTLPRDNSENNNDFCTVMDLSKGRFRR